MRDLPHDPYADAIDKALTAAGLGAHEIRTSRWDEYEDDGCLTPSLVISWEPEDLPKPTVYPHGLCLYWTVRTGWGHMAMNDRGFGDNPDTLPLPVWAHPDDITAAVRNLAAGAAPADTDREWTGPDAEACRTATDAVWHDGCDTENEGGA